jgi:endonuclease YncB( thermonuclease family)
MSKIEDEFDAIRDKIYEKIKDMSPEEEIAYIKAQADAVCKEFGIWQHNTEKPEKSFAITANK